jgi:hypothetical protein
VQSLKIEGSALSCHSSEGATLQCGLRKADIHELRNISTVAMTGVLTELATACGWLKAHICGLISMKN